MKVGYARVSTDEQNLDLQLAALNATGCAKIYQDKGISGANFDRPGLRQVISALHSGDVVVVWKLDRLGRSLVDLVNTIDGFAALGVEFCSLTENIDTSSPGGKLIFHIMAALAEFERSLISERTRAGLDAARARGIRIGRPPALDLDQKLEVYRAIIKSRENITMVAKRYNVHPRTIERVVKKLAVSQLNDLIPSTNSATSPGI
jgi:DNA invertase Pin-like site-specific DNA recombinase